MAETEIVEVPALMSGGQVTLVDPVMRKMARSDLKLLAKTLDSQLIWVKRRLVYEELEVALCTHEDCYRPAKGLDCGGHNS